MPETDQKTREAAEQIMLWSRKKLAMELPAFLPAIYLLKEVVCEEPGPLWTDGESIYYHPATVIQTYLERKNAISEQIIHIIAHGLLGHFPKRKGQLESLFDAAADVKVAAFLHQLDASYLNKRTWETETALLVKKQKNSTLESLYLAPASSEEARVLVSAAQPLKTDSHAAWCRQMESGQGNGNGKSVAFLEGLWQSAAQQVAENLVQQGQGELAAGMCEDYREVQESTVSYTEFLKQFCTIQERRQIDPDSIDQLWYHVGLDLTGDTPLVEPLEVREDAPALELAVALDTSGSCCGETMKGFLGELLAILRDTGGPKVELTLIQCDAEIQDVRVLTREDSTAEIERQFEISGCGGTDFCPVFDYVNKQREDPEGKNFRGLLYLSDGYGDFPDEEPEYPVVFLMPREEDDWGWGDPLPEWVTEVRITEDNRLAVQDKSKKRR